MKHEKRIAMWFSAVAVMLVASVAIAYYVGWRVLSQTRTIEEHRVTIGLVQETLSTIKDAETGQRGYLITGEEAYLAPYTDAVAHAHDQLATLKGRVPADRLRSLQGTLEKKLAELNRTVELRRSGETDVATSIVKGDEGKRLMDSIRADAAELIRNEESILHKAQKSADRGTNFRTAVFVIVVGVNLIFLWWAFNQIQKEMYQRIAADKESRQQKDLLAVTLASVGDAIIVTDTGARIIYMNPVAETLTGWTMAEAAGKPCGKVFQIINEDSRATVESPVDKVLREGVIVGLANHTLLIRKNGEEVPIDDSGAPVREPDGAVRGVVLVFRDFSEHKEAERKLRHAKEELEAAAKAKDQFLATLSHELRTPLTPVLATLSVWETSEQLPQQVRSDVLMLRRNVELEARLIDDLLDLTKIVKGKLTLNPEVCDVHDLVQAVVQVYQSELHAKRLELAIALSADRRHVTADPARLQQVFWNILKNATKFTPEGGRITIASFNDENGRVHLSFTDTGIGMTPEVLAKIFQPFEQGTQETGRRYGGLGLGMSISKALMDAHGGVLSASSKGTSQGSTFTVSMLSVLAPSRSTTDSAPPASSSTKQFRKLRILLVEDHADSAMVVQRLLVQLGHAVEIRDSVAGATQLFGDGNIFDLLLSDIGLPDGTGIDLIREIRKQHQLPAVALTGFGMEEDINRCREAGFNAHLTKPVSFQKLEALLRDLAS